MTAPNALTTALTGGRRLVVASHNSGKVREIGELLRPFGLNIVSAGELGLPEPEENGASFSANAILKAVAAAEASGEIALSDDSGLEVAALDGQPGIHSARWAGPEKDFTAAMARIQRELADRGAVSPQDRRANFTCVLSLAMPDGTSTVYEGRVYGHLVWPPRGEKGFGYDPVFVPDGHRRTFAEMEPEEKHAMSHRAKAFAAFVADCFPPDRDGDGNGNG